MKNRSNFILALFSFFILFNGAVGAGPLQQIQKEFEQGKLTLDERVILEIKAIKFPDQLPASLKSAQAGLDPGELRSATPIIFRIFSEWDKLSPETQA